MLLAIGSKVRLKHTGDEGIITEILDSQMFQVFIPSLDTQIPVFEEDLVKPENYKGYKPSAISRPSKPVVQQKTPTVEIYTSDSNSAELYLAFDPEYDNEGIVKRYQLFLINDTPVEYIFSVVFKSPTRVDRAFHGKLPLSASYFLHDLAFDQLNDTPSWEVEIREWTKEGTGKKRKKVIKLKHQQFFKKIALAPLLKRPVHLYTLSDAAEESNEKNEDLIDYTKKNIQPVKQQSTHYQYFNQHNVEEYASFPNEIDLHIENLHNNPTKLSNSEMLRIQLENFETYMEKAIRLGVPNVFIVHGLGKGKLKDMITSRLILMREVKSFKNEYHPRYGWGATEVIL